MPGGRVEVEVVPDLKDFPGKLSSGLKSASGLAGTLGKGLGLAIAAGTAVAAIGLKSVIDLGVEYTNNLNELQSVTQATGLDMARVGNLAKQLGADMSLPATSAADAAAAMKELAKGGLSVDEAMTAAKGTLQLAAAAQSDAARAAEIQSDALNQFGLAADQAGHVADILANTANAASGEITDMANALKFVGPVARGIGVDIDTTATAIGLLAVNGIRGEQAGTSLRGMIASLASPSKPAAEALKALGIAAFDASGKFIGLRAFTDQLAAAKGRLTDAEFASAASIAFGNEGFTAANALALSGATAFDEMAKSVGRAGGAAEVSAARTKGLGGAWEGLKSQLETTGIGIFEAIDGPLEKLVRGTADKTAQVGDAVVKGLNVAVAAGEVYGPRLAAAVSSRAGVVGDAIDDVFGEIARGSTDALNEGINRAIGLWDDLTETLGSVVDGARPVARGIADLVRAAADGDGPISALGSGVGILGDTVRVASGVLAPLGRLVGGLVSAFADLPGPVQTAVVALGLVAAFRNPLSALGDTVRTRVTEPFRNFSETLRLQQALLTGSTRIASQQVGQMGLAFAALEARVPVIGRMADSFRSASTAAQGFVVNQSALLQTAAGISNQYTGLATALNRSEGALRGVAGAAAGTAAALGTGLRAAASGLVGVLGGPWGVAMAAAGVGLSLLAANQQKAAQAAQKHASYVDGLAAALHESNGAIDENVRATTAKSLQDTKVADTQQSVADAAREAGISLGDLTKAMLGGGPALDTVRDKLRAVAEANKEMATTEGGGDTLQWTGSFNAKGEAANALLVQIDGLAGGFKEAQAKEEALKQAIREGRASMLDASDSGRDLSGAMKVLASTTASADDKARALKSALDALAGGSISLEAAQARMYETLSRLGSSFGENLDKTKGWGTELNNAGAALIKADGSINLTTENGRNLSRTLQDLSTHTAEVAQKTYDMAISQGETVPQATAKAQAAMQLARDAFIETKTAMGLTAAEAGVLADKAGLIPKNVALLIQTPGMSQAQKELLLLKEAVNGVPPGKTITAQTLSADAEQKLRDLGFTVIRTPNNVQITANSDAARDELNKFLATPATKTVRIVYTGGEALPIGGRAVNYHGNLIPAQGFANGGVAKPFKAGIAQMFPPRLLRITGDRMVDDEAYIPVNRSLRSQQLLQETASRMGYDLIRRFAIGGFASGQTATSAPQAMPAFPTTLTLVDSEGAFLGRMRVVAEQAVAHVEREVYLRGGRR